MPIIYSVLQGFVAYFRIRSERAQDSPGVSQDLRQTPPGRPYALALTGDDARALSVPVQRPGLTRRWIEGPANLKEIDFQGAALTMVCEPK